VPRIVKKPAERRAEIVASARRLFQTQGYEATSMQDVLTDLGIAKGTIYHYFRSKEDLLDAVCDDIVETTTAQMRGLADSTSGTALDKLRAVILGGEISAEDTELLRQLRTGADPGMHSRLLAVAINAQGPLYADLLDQGRAEGTFRIEDPLETAEFLLTAFQFLTDRQIYPWTVETLIRRGRAMPALMDRLLGAEPGTFAFLTPPDLTPSETDD
jgi:AcrR family transcriptional regulator